jgi:CDP-diacylglycerol---serine O-phosphatidyltransferase
MHAPARHFSMIRSFQPADFLTLGNAACGAAGVLLAMRAIASQAPADILWAAAMAPLAFIFDVLDGRVARMTGRASLFGRELDSLADVVSFGVAPAALAYAAGIDGGWDAVVLLYFVCCGVSRLARYNVTADAMSAEAGKVTYFEGTPIPTSIVLVGVIAALAWNGLTGDALPLGSWALGPWQLHPLVLLYGLSGSLMISKTLHIPKP